MKKQLEKAKGITLIALVITIIVLLILAGVSIATLVGEGGILSKATKAKNNTEEAQILEEVELVVAELKMDEIYQGKLSNDEFSKQLSDKLKGVVIGEVTDEKIKIEYKDYELEIDNERKVEIKGKIKIKINYTLDPTEDWTNNPVIINMDIKCEDGLSVLSFMPIGENIEVVEENIKFKVIENGLYKFEVTDNTFAKKEVTIPIQNIDKDPPETKIEMITSTNFINGKIKAKVTIQDEKSGIDLEKCKWVVNTNKDEIGTNEASYTGTFSKETGEIKEQEIESAALTVTGKYYFHILAVDKLGNTKEVISEEAEVKNGYAIATPTDFQNMKNNLSAQYYVVNDIDMKDFSFTTIPGSFIGSIDGQGHTISNLTASRSHI